MKVTFLRSALPSSLIIQRPNLTKFVSISCDFFIRFQWEYTQVLIQLEFFIVSSNSKFEWRWSGDAHAGSFTPVLRRTDYGFVFFGIATILSGVQIPYHSRNASTNGANDRGWRQVGRKIPRASNTYHLSMSEWQHGSRFHYKSLWLCNASWNCKNNYRRIFHTLKKAMKRQIHSRKREQPARGKQKLKKHFYLCMKLGHAGNG